MLGQQKPLFGTNLNRAVGFLLELWKYYKNLVNFYPIEARNTAGILNAKCTP